LRKVEANLRAIEKWNGILPQVTGAGAVPFIGVGDPGKITPVSDAAKIKK
jgi:hypothetical protein